MGKSEKLFKLNPAQQKIVDADKTAKFVSAGRRCGSRGLNYICSELEKIIGKNPSGGERGK